MQVLPSTGICPSGARIWPKIGHWVADEKPPVIESGLSPDPLACPAPSHKRCLGWDVMNRTTKCGDLYAPGLYLCAECKSGYYSTSWDPSCSPCASSNGTYHGSSLSSDSNEFIILAISVFSYMSFLALSVFSFATFVRVTGNRAYTVRGDSSCLPFQSPSVGPDV